ncbi:MAG: hypothetical protein ACE5Z5_07120 [Candidatus Bathyarchaeia archaeon]
METLPLRDGLKTTTIRLGELEEFFTSYQGGRDDGDCPLCGLDVSGESVHHVSEGFLIVDTKDRKGHKNRIMVITREHGVEHPKRVLDQAILTLIRVGRELFDSDFCLLSDKFSSIKNHWHIVASDFDGGDYEQMMSTPFVLIPNSEDSRIDYDRTLKV